MALIGKLVLWVRGGLMSIFILDVDTSSFIGVDSLIPFDFVSFTWLGFNQSFSRHKLYSVI